jgi:hypothetical protein
MPLEKSGDVHEWRALGRACRAFQAMRLARSHRSNSDSAASNTLSIALASERLTDRQNGQVLLPSHNRQPVGNP